MNDKVISDEFISDELLAAFFDGNTTSEEAAIIQQFEDAETLATISDIVGDINMLETFPDTFQNTNEILMFAEEMEGGYDLEVLGMHELLNGTHTNDEWLATNSETDFIHDIGCDVTTLDEDLHTGGFNIVDDDIDCDL